MTAAAAGPDPAMQLEVEQLLVRLGTSACQFQRNGSWYGAAQARQHLEQKYRYLLVRERVRSAEDFIALAGTRSSTTGSPYLVQCGGQAQSYSAQWLATQLSELRASTRVAPPVR